jgi:hypothetical protein
MLSGLFAGQLLVCGYLGLLPYELPLPGISNCALHLAVQLHHA